MQCTCRCVTTNPATILVAGMDRRSHMSYRILVSIVVPGLGHLGLGYPVSGLAWLFTGIAAYSFVGILGSLTIGTLSFFAAQRLAKSIP